MTGLQPAPEQWMPPPPVTDADRMAQAIYVQLVVREQAPAALHPDRALRLRDIAQHAAACYFEGNIP